MLAVRMGLDDPTPSVSRSVPEPVRGVPNEVIVPSHVREASIRTFLKLGPTVRDLKIDRSVRKCAQATIV